MIIGIGIDIIRNERIAKLFLEKPDKLKQRILSLEEQNEFSTLRDDCSRITFLSKRFVAKEALGKAIGCGINNTYLSLTDITVAHNKFGKPFFVKNAKISDTMRKLYHLSSYEIMLSITDEKKYSLANVIIQDKQFAVMDFLHKK